MSMLLFIIGGIAVMVGAATVAFGIPINEFSFGNTLIISGTTIGAGGLIIIAVAAAVAQLTRIAEALAARPAALPQENFEPPPEAPGTPAPGRIPFPSRTRPETRPVEPPSREPQAFEPPVEAELATEEEHPAESFAPALRNPETPPMTVEEEVSLSPQPARAPGEFAEPPRPAPPREPAYEPPNFDAMWPAKPEPPPPSPPRAVAILKSGVIDGMGYTLYVDGSIEAELPQGKLHFASIDELRAHLEKGS